MLVLSNRHRGVDPASERRSGTPDRLSARRSLPEHHRWPGTGGVRTRPPIGLDLRGQSLQKPLQSRDGFDTRRGSAVTRHVATIHAWHHVDRAGAVGNVGQGGRRTRRPPVRGLVRGSVRRARRRSVEASARTTTRCQAVRRVPLTAIHQAPRTRSQTGRPACCVGTEDGGPRGRTSWPTASRCGCATFTRPSRSSAKMEERRSRPGSGTRGERPVASLLGGSRRWPHTCGNAARRGSNAIDPGRIHGRDFVERPKGDSPPVTTPARSLPISARSMPTVPPTPRQLGRCAGGTATPGG